MTYEELMDLLIARNALIVHCSRLGKGDDFAAGGLLFPEDLRRAKTICDKGRGQPSCSLIWPTHTKTFGAVGIVLKPRSIASITEISPIDAGSSYDANGNRTGSGVPFSRQAVEDTFASSQDYNEWIVTNADTIGLFVNLNDPWQIAKEVPISTLAGYDPSLGDLGTTVAPHTLNLTELKDAIPSLPVYGFCGLHIVEITTETNRTVVTSASLYH
jgi:hypothetical protein